MTERSDKNPVLVSIGRQPIFDKQRKLWGYELFCVGSEQTHSGFPVEESVAGNVQSSAYVCLQQITKAGKNVMVDFTEKSILENLPYVLPPNLATIRVLEHVGDSRTVLESLDRLKSDGYLLAVEGFSGNPACAPLYQLADIISTSFHPDRRDAVA